MRMGPIVVRAFLLPLPIHPRQILPRRRRDTGGLRQLGQELLIGGPVIAPDNAPQRRIRFQGRRIDAQGLALQQARLGDALQDPREHGLMGLQIDQAAGARNRRVIGRRLVQTETEKLPQGQRIRRAPSNPAFGIDALKIPNQQQPEIDGRGQARAPHRGRIESDTAPFDERVKLGLREQRIQPLIERVCRRRRQIAGGDPYRCLAGRSTFAHGHARHCSTPPTLTKRTRQRLSTFTTGCRACLEISVPGP